MYNAFLRKLGIVDQATEAFNTAIFDKVDPCPGARTCIQRLSVLTLGTAHVLTVMQSIKKVYATAQAAAAQAIVNISEDPASIATNDYCIIKLADGTYQMNMVASVSTLAITFTDVFSAIVEKNAPIWFFGVVGDSHPQYVLTANAENEFASDYGYFVAPNKYEPLILSVNNVTAASIIQGGVVAYVNS